jgi:hypothetical protein
VGFVHWLARAAGERHSWDPVLNHRWSLLNRSIAAISRLVVDAVGSAPAHREHDPIMPYGTAACIRRTGRFSPPSRPLPVTEGSSVKGRQGQARIAAETDPLVASL